jgi:hypothetical protein
VTSALADGTGELRSCPEPAAPDEYRSLLRSE